MAARTNALTTGEVDLIDRLDIKTLHLLKRNKKINIHETSGTAHYTAAMRTDIPPFDNNHVRLALKLAVDREALMQNVLRGHGVLGNDHPIGLSNRYHASASELPQRQYDPEKARFHLKKAGLSSLKVHEQSQSCRHFEKHFVELFHRKRSVHSAKLVDYFCYKSKMDHI